MSLQIQPKQFQFGHLFDCIADAFAAEAGIFDAAVGHGVDPISREVKADRAPQTVSDELGNTDEL